MNRTWLSAVAAALFLALGALNAGAFSLLGPFESWMVTTNGFSPSDAGDIGGPMCLGSGYRWNVPTLTHGFDQSFLDFFGTNGVAAVEGAIQILNALPPASEIIVTNYPMQNELVNYIALGQNLWDLKTEALALLLEQMGLAQPQRYILVLRRWDPAFENEFFNDGTSIVCPTNFWPPGAIPYNIVMRNYDPETLEPSTYLNDILYSGEVTTLPAPFNCSYADAFSLDPYEGYLKTAVADQGQKSGNFFQGLTYDDVGGLRYLLSTNNINYETLLPGVTGAGTNTASFVNGARRPGVDKIIFVPRPADASGAFLPWTNYFTDAYYETNGTPAQQQLARVVSQPDILFSAGDVFTNALVLLVPFFGRTDCSHWSNNAVANGNTNGSGPGVIQPPVKITFEKLGASFIFDGNEAAEQSAYWGSFDRTTNPPVAYPIAQAVSNRLTLRLWLQMPGWALAHFDWKRETVTGALFDLQTSTDLANWTTLFTATNNGSVATCMDYSAWYDANRFYRLMPH